MHTVLALFLGLLARLGRSRQDLLLENFALRHQLMMCERRPRVTDADRVLWAHLLRHWSGWRTSLVILHPDTVVRWHRAGWRRFWARKSRARRPGRRRIPAEARELIWRLARENPRWGAMRIRAELRPLGYDVSAETVRRYRLQARRRPPSQRWRTFLRNHREAIWATDFLTVPTLTFGTLYVFFVISHARRRIVHVSPCTVEGVVEQILTLREQIGPFGTLVYTGIDWADEALGCRSMELMAEQVMPRVNAALQADEDAITARVARGATPAG